MLLFNFFVVDNLCFKCENCVSLTKTRMINSFFFFFFFFFLGGGGGRGRESEGRCRCTRFWELTPTSCCLSIIIYPYERLFIQYLFLFMCLFVGCLFVCLFVCFGG